MKENEMVIVTEKAGLKNPGDKMSACITDTGRKVIKVETDNGTNKYSATQYQNGTVVETKTTKMH